MEQGPWVDHRGSLPGDELVEIQEHARQRRPRLPIGVGGRSTRLLRGVRRLGTLPLQQPFERPTLLLPRLASEAEAEGEPDAIGVAGRLADQATARARANSKKASSLSSVSAWSGVFERMRRVQAWVPSGASKTISDGCGVARQKKV